MSESCECILKYSFAFRWHVVGISFAFVRISLEFVSTNLYEYPAGGPRNSAKSGCVCEWIMCMNSCV